VVEEDAPPLLRAGFRGCKRVGTRVKFPTLSDPYARDGHRFESPQLHQGVRANRCDFLVHKIRTTFSKLAAVVVQPAMRFAKRFDQSGARVSGIGRT
jgi:hypothetical protein